MRGTRFAYIVSGLTAASLSSISDLVTGELGSLMNPATRRRKE